MPVTPKLLRLEKKPRWRTNLCPFHQPRYTPPKPVVTQSPLPTYGLVGVDLSQLPPSLELSDDGHRGLAVGNEPLSDRLFVVVDAPAAPAALHDPRRHDLHARQQGARSRRPTVGWQGSGGGERVKCLAVAYSRRFSGGLVDSPLACCTQVMCDSWDAGTHRLLLEFQFCSIRLLGHCRASTLSSSVACVWGGGVDLQPSSIKRHRLQVRYGTRGTLAVARSTFRLLSS